MACDALSRLYSVWWRHGWRADTARDYGGLTDRRARLSFMLPHASVLSAVFARHVSRLFVVWRAATGADDRCARWLRCRKRAAAAGADRGDRCAVSGV